MSDAVKEFPYIALERPHSLRVVPRELLCERLETFNRSMYALGLPARIRIKYERSVETRRYDSANGVVQNAISHACLGNMSQLRILDEKTCVRTVLVFSPN